MNNVKLNTLVFFFSSSNVIFIATSIAFLFFSLLNFAFQISGFTERVLLCAIIVFLCFVYVLFILVCYVLFSKIDHLTRFLAFILVDDSVRRTDTIFYRVYQITKIRKRILKKWMKMFSQYSFRIIILNESYSDKVRFGFFLNKS